MMHNEVLRPLWPSYYDVMDSIHDHNIFSPIDNSLEIFSVSSESLQVAAFTDDLPMSFEEFEPYSCFGFGFEGLLEESVGSFPSQTSSPSSAEMSPMQQVLILPCEEIEIENELSVSHLVRAYCDAVENEQRELERVILRRIREKSSPLGKPLERIAFYLSQNLENDDEFAYLCQESLKSFQSAMEAFHRIFPYTKFAHFTANSAILDSTPNDVETIHIIDFDIREGLQWAQMIEAAAERNKRLKVTSIRWEEKESESDCDRPMRFGFEKTRRKLIEHARSIGVGLKIEEIRIEDLMKKGMKNDKGNEYLAFNCVVGISPRVRNRRLVIEFLNLAKELLVGSFSGNNTNGIIVLANGDPSERLLESCTSFSSFFDGHFGHCKAMLESMESGFPTRLAEARVGMECLFVAPCVSARAWCETWREAREGCDSGGREMGMGMEGWRMRKESVKEVKEMVRGESSFGVSVGGVNGNEAALEWNGIPLVRVSAWISQN